MEPPSSSNKNDIPENISNSSIEDELGFNDDYGIGAIPDKKSSGKDYSSGPRAQEYASNYSDMPISST
jgi:hypothetical protein